MNLIYFSVNPIFDEQSHRLFEEQSHRWDNINNLTSFLFLWFFVILLSSVFFKVLVYIYGLFKKSPSNDSFFLLVFILFILFSIFSTMDFFMSHPVGLEKQPECINPVWETGKFGERYLKCDNK
jgi:H+/Cl- antiporter ClcA